MDEDDMMMMMMVITMTMIMTMIMTTTTTTMMGTRAVCSLRPDAAPNSSTLSAHVPPHSLHRDLLVD